jgi:hypothetical protein
MVEGYAHITVRGVTSTIKLSPLECARIWCQRAGFDVDAEPTGQGDGWKLTAKAGSATASVMGKTLHEAVTKIVEAIK